jgi:CheY-like chemotaxis protein
MAETDHSSEDQEPKVITVLVVDDDEAIGEFIVEALKLETSYRPLRASNGSEALEMIKTLVPDLIVLDYHLPGINGLELGDRLHAIKTLTHIPILLMSANVPQRELEKHSFAAIEKPFGLDELMQAIEKLVAE